MEAEADFNLENPIEAPPAAPHSDLKSSSRRTFVFSATLAQDHQRHNTPHSALKTPPFPKDHLKMGLEFVDRFIPILIAF